MDTTLPYEVCVIDFLAVYDNQKNYVVKELSAFRMTSCQTWFFNLPPAVKCHLVANSNDYLEKQFHGIPVDYGQIPYDELLDVLYSVTFKASYVFAKGQQKCNFLRERLPNLIVIDLNVLRCTKHYKPTLTCMYHFDKLDKECAFRNCSSNASWLCNFISFEQTRIAFMKLHCPMSTASKISNCLYLPFSRAEVALPYSNSEDRIKSYRCDKFLDVVGFWRDIIANESQS